jgi:methionine biosynthesis protein MetW
MRQDLIQIAEWIEDRTRILDLGCGDGTLLTHLRDAHGCTGYGIEIADSSVLACVRHAVNVIQADLESGLKMFADAMFDTVVLSQTLQSMHKVEAILLEIVRVGRQGIVSFPNFG